MEGTVPSLGLNYSTLMVLYLLAVTVNWLGRGILASSVSDLDPAYLIDSDSYYSY